MSQGISADLRRGRKQVVGGLGFTSRSVGRGGCMPLPPLRQEARPPCHIQPGLLCPSLQACQVVARSHRVPGGRAHLILQTGHTPPTPPPPRGQMEPDEQTERSRPQPGLPVRWLRTSLGRRDPRWARAGRRIPFQYHPDLGQRTKLPWVPQGGWLWAKKEITFQI